MRRLSLIPRNTTSPLGHRQVLKVFRLILGFASVNGGAVPSIMFLSRAAGCSTNKIDVILHHLAKIGCLTIADDLDTFYVTGTKVQWSKEVERNLAGIRHAARKPRGSRRRAARPSPEVSGDHNPLPEEKGV